MKISPITLARNPFDEMESLNLHVTELIESSTAAAARGRPSQTRSESVGRLFRNRLTNGTELHCYYVFASKQLSNELHTFNQPTTSVKWISVDAQNRRKMMMWSDHSRESNGENVEQSCRIEIDISFQIVTE